MELIPIVYRNKFFINELFQKQKIIFGLIDLSENDLLGIFCAGSLHNAYINTFANRRCGPEEVAFTCGNFTVVNIGHFFTGDVINRYIYILKTGSAVECEPGGGVSCF
jgi:hypothetical protein